KSFRAVHRLSTNGLRGLWRNQEFAIPTHLDGRPEPGRGEYDGGLLHAEIRPSGQELFTRNANVSSVVGLRGLKARATFGCHPSASVISGERPDAPPAHGDRR